MTEKATGPPCLANKADLDPLSSLYMVVITAVSCWSGLDGVCDPAGYFSVRCLVQVLQA